MAEGAVRPGPHVSVARFDEGAVLFTGDRVHRLDRWGMQLFDRLQTAPLAQLVDQLAAESGAGAATVAADLDAFVDALRAGGILDDRPAVAPAAASAPPRPEPPAGGAGTVAGATHAAGPFRALGWAFSVRSSDQQLARYVAELFAPFAASGQDEHVYVVTRADRRWTVTVDGVVQLRTPWLWLVVAWLQWHVNQQVIATTTTHVLVHASVVADGDGALVLAGPMNAGKTTLAAVMLARGFRCLTDEAAAFSLASGRLEPYPRPLAVERSGWDLLPELEPPRSWRRRFQRRQWHLPMPSPTPGESFALRAVVLPSVDAGGPVRFEAVTPPEALEALCEHAFNLTGLGAAAFDVLAGAIRGAGPAYRLTVSDLDRAAGGLASILRGRSPVRALGAGHAAW